MSEYRADDQMSFERLDDDPGFEPGTVRIIFREESNDVTYHTIPPNIWASLVLTMTKFSERPNDWQAFMSHHQGRQDMLGAAKTLATIQNVIRCDTDAAKSP